MNIDWLGLASLLLVGLTLYALMVAAHIAWMLTHPPRRGYGWAVARGVPGDPAEVLLAETTGANGPESDPPSGPAARMNEWAVRARFHEREFRGGGSGLNLKYWDVVGGDASGPVVVVTHGWGDSRVVMLSRLPALYPVCSRVILWDLPAHGDSPRGGVCTLGVRERDDLIALVRLLAESDTSGIVLMGFSLGAGVSIAAAEALSGAGLVQGVIAEAPYRLPITPARNVLRERGLPHRGVLPLALAALGVTFERGVGGLRWGQSDWPRDVRTRASAFEDRSVLVGRLGLSSRPLLIICGDADDVCPLDESEAIFNEARGAGSGHARLAVIAGASHLNLWTNASFEAAARSAVRTFLNDLRHQRGEVSCG